MKVDAAVKLAASATLPLPAAAEARASDCPKILVGFLRRNNHDNAENQDRHGIR
jgi:hypothetical protein